MANYPELTKNTRDWFENEYRELFFELDGIEDSLAGAIRDGNEKRASHEANRREIYKSKIRELDKVLLGVFHAERRWHPDEFFPDIDRYDITPIQEPDHESVPSDEQLANSWQDDLIYSYRSER